MISDVEDFHSVKDLFYHPNYYIFMLISIQATKKWFEIKFENGKRTRDLSREDTFKDDDLSRNLIRSGCVGETCSSAAGLLNSQTFRSEK